MTEDEIAAALSGPLPAGDLGGLKRRTRALMGRCQGFNCLGARLSSLRRAGSPCRRWRRSTGQGMAERVRLAIVGGGPAGLSAALEARRLGLPAVVLEREAEAGGAVRHCGHLGFGMLDLRRMLTGPRYAAALRDRARLLDIRCSHAVTAVEPDGVVRVSTPAGPAVLEAERVLIATGIREMTRAERLVGGNRPFGVMTTGALQRFVYLDGVLPCRRPVIVGTEYVSLSTLLTLRHGGVKPVAFVAETSPTPAPRALVSLASRVFGVPVVPGTVEAVAGAGPG